jgi:hypothetical protein
MRKKNEKEIEDPIKTQGGCKGKGFWPSINDKFTDSEYW